jgi:hypothetical protein
VLRNGAVRYKTHVKNTGVSKTGILLLWEGNRFVPLVRFRQILAMRLRIGRRAARLTYSVVD